MGIDADRIAAPWFESEQVLQQARGRNAGPGSVAELHLKHLLALNLRKLDGAEMGFVPRSYVLQVGNHLEQEFERFVMDFKISQALAITKHVVEILSTPRTCCQESDIEENDQPLNAADKFEELSGNSHAASSVKGRQPEGLWGREVREITWQLGPDPSQPLDSNAIVAALSVTQRVVDELQHARSPEVTVLVDDAEWILIRRFSPQARLLDWSDSVLERAVALLKAIPASFQMSLLRANMWVLKPSTGQFGRGIMLLDRIPESPLELLEWANAVGRGGLKGNNDSKEGCVMQKLIEHPHLLHKEALSSIERSNEASAGDDIMGIPTALPSMDKPSLYKYNLRVWVVATLRDPPRVYLYREGFISLAMRKFTPSLDTLSHITNLRQGDGKDVNDAGPAGGDCQRRWSIRDFSSYLESIDGVGTYETRIAPQVRSILREMFRALALPPTALASDATAASNEEAQDGQEGECNNGRSAAGKKLRRLGLDFLVDEDFVVWLLEVNFLKNGYATCHAQKGPAGDAKRRLVKDMLEEENQLRIAISSGCEDDIPSAFEQLLPFSVP